MNFWKSFAYSFLFLSLIVYFVDIFLIKKDLFFFTKNEYEKIHKYEIIFNYSIFSKSKYILNVDQPINYYFNNGNHIEIYAWLPHFDLNNGLYSLKSQKDDIKEVHFAAFSINEDVTQPLIRSSNYEIGLNSLNSYVKFGINIHSSNPKTLSLFLSKVDYNLIVYEIKSLKRKYENLVSININFEKI
ncbi:MAG: hypothetical protein RMK17_02710, partial [bacterium]|nr:hypothetical protein [bacterium]